MISSLFARLLPKSLLIGSALLVSSTACVQDQEFLIVDRAVWFDATTCSLTGTEAAVSNLTADVKFSGTRIGVGLVVTNYTSTNPQSNTGLDDSEIVLDGAEVVLSFSGGGISANAFAAPIGQLSLFGGDTQSVVVEVPTSVVDSLRSTMESLPAGSVETLDMEITLTGRKSGASGPGGLGKVEARTFSYPLQICYGCMEVCLPATDCGGVEGDPPVCPTETVWGGGTCGYAQGPVYNPACTVTDG